MRLQNDLSSFVVLLIVFLAFMVCVRIFDLEKQLFFVKLRGIQ